MGQYFKIANLTKKQFLFPRTFNNASKLMEFSCDVAGVMTALAILKPDGNGKGGGDLHSENFVIGSWAGDYADDDKFLNKEQSIKQRMIAGNQADNLYHYVDNFFEDISEKLLPVILMDQYVFEQYEKSRLSGKCQEIFTKMSQRLKKNDKAG
jgi:hypothetical protein